jgi:uncharacterized protein
MGERIIGSGWSFPVKPAVTGGLTFTGGDQKIRQGIWMILSTAPGERVMLPDFGCGIHDLLFEPITAGLRALVQARVRDALTRWEPRIDVLTVSVETPADARNCMLIRIDYRLRRNNAFYNLVYPFFINEGAG